MDILVRMPNWIGDAVMATPALDNLRSHFRDARYTILASSAVAGLFEHDPRADKVIVDKSKTSKPRVFGLVQMARSLGRFDLALTFRNSFACALMLRLTRSRKIVGTAGRMRNFLLTHPVHVDWSLHQAEIYNQIVTGFTGQDLPTGKSTLFVQEKKVFDNKTVGIAPGASYGDAKRWDIEKFAELAIQLSKDYDILVLGSPQEASISKEMEKILVQNGVKNYQNLTGKTTVYDLVTLIAGLSLFITNDSGQMHIADAFDIPIVAIFGPTIATQTRPWNNERVSIVKKDIPCAPCMKRTCPLRHHDCMKWVKVDDVWNAVSQISQG